MYFNYIDCGLSLGNVWPWYVLKVLDLGLGLMTCGLINININMVRGG